MKRLTTFMGCIAVALMFSGCLPKVLEEKLNCGVIKNMYENAQENAAKGEINFGIKAYETDAEIQEALANNLDHYGNHWKKVGCPGSITDDHWRLR